MRIKLVVKINYTGYAALAGCRCIGANVAFCALRLNKSRDVKK